MELITEVAGSVAYKLAATAATAIATVCSSSSEPVPDKLEYT